MIRVSRNYMATIMVSSNAIAMVLIITVINGVVVRIMDVTLSMVSLIDTTIVGVAVRGIRMVALADITILGISLST